jgi:hypothetical protein
MIPFSGQNKAVTAPSIAKKIDSERRGSGMVARLFFD